MGTDKTEAAHRLNTTSPQQLSRLFCTPPAPHPPAACTLPITHAHKIPVRAHAPALGVVCAQHTAHNPPKIYIYIYIYIYNTILVYIVHIYQCVHTHLPWVWSAFSTPPTTPPHYIIYIIQYWYKQCMYTSVCTRTCPGYGLDSARRPRSPGCTATAGGGCWRTSLRAGAVYIYMDVYMYSCIYIYMCGCIYIYMCVCVLEA